MTFVLFLVAIQILATAISEIRIILQRGLDMFTSYDVLTKKSTLFISHTLTALFLSLYLQIMFQISVIVPFDLNGFSMYLIGQRFKEYASIEYAILSSPKTKWVHTRKYN